MLEEARAAGFDHAGIAAAGPLAGGEQLAFWLDAGRHGEMAYLQRTRHQRHDPRSLLPGARAVVVVAHVYKPPDDAGSASTRAAAGRGQIARYAWGADYHELIRRKLRDVVTALRGKLSEPFTTRICVDTAPILEREAAAAAGVGWIGKNTMAVHPRLGSFFFLGEIITTLDLKPSKPLTDHCGSCRRCLDACPTGAFIGPYRMDARRCIAYLTIEHRSDIPQQLQEGMGNWVFGCDICQEVCPYNRKAPATREPEYLLSERFPLPPNPSLEVLVQWDDEQQHSLADSAMNRARPEMLRRNARIAQINTAIGLVPGGLSPISPSSTPSSVAAKLEDGNS